MICAGTNSEMIFWDLKKMKIIQSYQSSHTDDVTAVLFHPANPNWLISCSTDNLLCHFNFEGKPTKTEEDTLEGVYSSEQPLIDCGFYKEDLIWAQTSINTVEMITVQDQDMYSKITKFPHQVEFVIGCGTDKWGGDDKFVIYGGNNQGEVYIYEMTGKNEVTLVDMIILG